MQNHLNHYITCLFLINRNQKYHCTSHLLILILLLYISSLLKPWQIHSVGKYRILIQYWTIVVIQLYKIASVASAIVQHIWRQCASSRMVIHAGVDPISGREAVNAAMSHVRLIYSSACTYSLPPSLPLLSLSFDL